MITFNCPECKTQLQRHDSEAGAQVPCPGCGQRLEIPQPPDLDPAGTQIGEWQGIQAGLSPRPDRAFDHSRSAPAGMLIRWSCPHCGARIKTDRLKGGTKAACPRCKLSVDIPSMDFRPRVLDRDASRSVAMVVDAAQGPATRTLSANARAQKPVWPKAVLTCSLGGLIGLAAIVLSIRAASSGTVSKTPTSVSAQRPETPFSPAPAVPVAQPPSAAEIEAAMQREAAVQEQAALRQYQTRLLEDDFAADKGITQALESLIRARDAGFKGVALTAHYQELLAQINRGIVTAQALAEGAPHLRSRALEVLDHRRSMLADTKALCLKEVGGVR